MTHSFSFAPRFLALPLFDNCCSGCYGFSFLCKCGCWSFKCVCFCISNCKLCNILNDCACLKMRDQCAPGNCAVCQPQTCRHSCPFLISCLVVAAWGRVYWPGRGFIHSFLQPLPCHPFSFLVLLRVAILLVHVIHTLLSRFPWCSDKHKSTSLRELIQKHLSLPVFMNILHRSRSPQLSGCMTNCSINRLK